MQAAEILLSSRHFFCYSAPCLSDPVDLNLATKSVRQPEHITTSYNLDTTSSTKHFFVDIYKFLPYRQRFSTLIFLHI